MTQVDVLCGGERAGALRWTEEGLYLRMELDCPQRQEGICRAYAVGERGEILLGVPEPVSGSLRLNRRLTRRSVSEIGPVLYGQLRFSEQTAATVWLPLHNGADFFRSGPFRGELRGVVGALWRQEGGLRLLALPFDSRRPFLLSSLFCFASVHFVLGREYAVFAFDGQDYPVFSRFTKNL